LGRKDEDMDGDALQAVLTRIEQARGGDLDAAVEACAAIGRFTLAHADRIAELDVNPLLVRPPGLGAVAADALVRLVETATDTGDGDTGSV
jgi:porphobilinogen deaminase